MDQVCSECKINLADYHDSFIHQGGTCPKCAMIPFKYKPYYDFPSYKNFDVPYYFTRFLGNNLCYSCFWKLHAWTRKLQKRHKSLSNNFKSQLKELHEQRVRVLSRSVRFHKNLNHLIAEYAIE
jgi:hypothetical protein